MTELQTLIDANWSRIESEIAINANRLLWRAKLSDAKWLPTRRLYEIIVEDIASLKASHEVWPAHLRQSFPFYELALLAEAYLARERLRIRRLIDAEGEQP